MVSLRDDQIKAAEVPLYIHERKAGCLRIAQDGLYTRFEAELPDRAAELVRLWAHGEGRRAYLGVMQPRGGGLWFSRKLSRRELAAFPDPIAYVSSREQEADELTEKDLHNQRDGEETAVEQEKESKKDLHNIESAGVEDEAESSPAEAENEASSVETNYRACPWPAEPSEGGLLWYSRPDGSLVSFDGISTLLALPAELRSSTPRAAERVIEGKKYLVFRT